MGGRTRRTIGAALAAGLAIGGAVALTSTSASGDEPLLVPFGTLTIDFGDRDGTVTLDYADPSIPDVTQAIVTQQPCAQIGFAPLAGGDLVTLTPVVGGATTAADTVQLPDNAIGVNTGTNCGTPAGLIGPNELLEIELGSFINADPAAPEVFATSADVAIDKKFNNDGRLTVGYDGGSQGSPISVARGGQTISLTPTDAFTSVTLGSTSNRDNRGLSVGDTVIELVADSGFEVAVDCGDFVEENGVIDAVYTRGANDSTLQEGKDDPDADCSDVGVTVENETDDDGGPRLFWDNGAISVVDGTDQAVAAKIEITWPAVPASSAGTPTEIDYTAGGGGGYVASEFCLSFSEVFDPVEEALVFTVEFPPYTGPGNIDGKAPWCVVSRTDEISGAFVNRTETMVGRGDPWGRFR